MSVEPPEFRHSQLEINGAAVHIVETGDPAARPFLFLHGWPEAARCWREVMREAGSSVRAIAVDLPGIGESVDAATDGSKVAIAAVVHQVIGALGLTRTTLVGQDAGGMVAYPYLRRYSDVEQVVIMDVVIPGLDPWDEVLHNPYLWHFAFHATQRLPELLVTGHQRAYFDSFFDALSANPAGITDEARSEYARAYSDPRALTAGFNWYRAFPADAQANIEFTGPATDVPLLYLRGEHEGGDLERYAESFRRAGVRNVQAARVPGAGHFTQEESPSATWRLIREFAEG